MSADPMRRPLPHLELSKNGKAPVPGGSIDPASEAHPDSLGPSPAANPSASPRGGPEHKPLSKFERLYLALSVVGLLISVLGFTAIIVSIRTAQVQMNHVAAQTRILSRDRSVSNVLTLHKIFLDHPELRPYFFEGKDLKESDPLYPQVEAVADMHLDVFAYNLDYRLVFSDDCRRPEEYKSYIRSRLALSPVMRRRLETNAAWFSPYLQCLDADRAALCDSIGGTRER
jgi:hypothetical protein